MTTNDANMARKFLRRLKDLSSDDSGSQSYRNYADTLLYDISGLKHIATIVLSHRNPAVAALRMINHPRSAGLAKMLLNDSDFKVLNQLVTAAYMAKQIALKTKSERSNDDVRTYKYLAKLYKKGINGFKEKYGYDLSTKKRVKNQFGALRDFIDGHDDYDIGDDFFDSDEDDGDDFFADDEYGDDDDDSLFDEDDRSQISVGALIDELRRHGYTITAPPRRGMPINYNPDEMPEMNFDFSGKATLEIISDRLMTLCEGMQMVLNRIYGREIDMIDHDVPPAPKRDTFRPSGKPISPFFGLSSELSKLSREELIRLYNALGSSLAQPGVMEFDPDADDDEDDFGEDVSPRRPIPIQHDLDDQLDALRGMLDSEDAARPDNWQISAHMEPRADHLPEPPSDDSSEDEEFPMPVIDPKNDVGEEGESVVPTTDGGSSEPQLAPTPPDKLIVEEPKDDAPKEQTAAEMFNAQNANPT